MAWKPIHTADELAAVQQAASQKPQVLFKHSTRCSISAMAKARFERAWTTEDDARFDAHLIHVVENREVSNQVAEALDVHHESPQLIVLHHDEVLLDQSHGEIALDEVREVIAARMS